MVRRVPGTDVPLDQSAAVQMINRAKAKLGCLYVLWLIVCTPVVVGFILGSITIAIAGLVFAIQALVVGTATYQTSCSTVGVWLVVFGSLVIGSTGLNCLCAAPASKKDDGQQEEQKGGMFTLIANLASLAAFGWLCYGINLVYNQGSQLEACNKSQYDVFYLMVMFMFWGSIAMLATMLFLLCCFCPFGIVLIDIARQDSGAPSPPPAHDLEKGFEQDAPVPAESVRATQESTDQRQIASV